MLTLTCVHVRAYTLLHLLFAIKSIFTYAENTGHFSAVDFVLSHLDPVYLIISWIFTYLVTKVL